MFLELSLVKSDLLVAFVQAFLEKGNVLLIFFALNHHLLDGAFLLAQDLDGFSVTSLLFVQFQFHVADASFQLADDAFATDNSIGFNFFETNGQVLDFDFERLLDGFDFKNAFLFFVEYFDGVFDFGLKDKYYINRCINIKRLLLYICSKLLYKKCSSCVKKVVLPVHGDNVHQKDEVLWRFHRNHQ